MLSRKNLDLKLGSSEKRFDLLFCLKTALFNYILYLKLFVKFFSVFIIKTFKFIDVNVDNCLIFFFVLIIFFVYTTILFSPPSFITVSIPCSNRIFSSSDKSTLTP